MNNQTNMGRFILGNNEKKSIFLKKYIKYNFGIIKTI